MPHADDSRETEVREAGTAAVVDEYIHLVVVVSSRTSGVNRTIPLSSPRAPYQNCAYIPTRLWRRPTVMDYNKCPEV